MSEETKEPMIPLPLDPFFAIEHSMWVIETFEMLYADDALPPYDDYPKDKKKTLIRAMAIIYEAQEKIKAQIKGL